MTVFELDLGLRKLKSDGADGIDYVNRVISEAVHKRIAEKTLTKKELAERLELHKSEVSRLLRGNQNITARKFGELMGALDFSYKIELVDLLSEGSNSDAHSSYPLTKHRICFTGQADKSQEDVLDVKFRKA